MSTNEGFASGSRNPGKTSQVSTYCPIEQGWAACMTPACVGPPSTREFAWQLHSAARGSPWQPVTSFLASFPLLCSLTLTTNAPLSPSKTTDDLFFASRTLTDSRQVLLMILLPVYPILCNFPFSIYSLSRLSRFTQYTIFRWCSIHFSESSSRHKL